MNTKYTEIRLKTPTGGYETIVVDGKGKSYYKAISIVDHEDDYQIKRAEGSVIIPKDTCLTAKLFDHTKDYGWNHVPDKSKLPDPQLTHKVEGANVPIQKVGINHFDSPLDFKMQNGTTIKLKGDFSAYVSLGIDKKGINMSRLAILIDEYTRGTKAGVDVLCNIAEEMIKRLESEDAYIKVKFDFPMKQNSLRSKDAYGNSLSGWIYYPSILEVKQKKNEQPQAFLTTIFTYSSACPCSYELAKDATATRQAAAISHSQRSFATTVIEFDPTKGYDIEQLIEHHRSALQTECQVMVKREDEQAFAELNGAYPKFVEDAARLMYDQLQSDPDVLDFCISCLHAESLHPHNAVGVIYKGKENGLR